MAAILSERQGVMREAEISAGRLALQVALDDDQAIHDAWRRRFAQVWESTGRGQLLHFSDENVFVSFVKSSPRADVYLLDYELVGASCTGLDLVRQMNLSSSAILVTSHSAEQRLQRACVACGVQILSKASVMHVPLVLGGSRERQVE